MPLVPLAKVSPPPEEVQRLHALQARFMNMAAHELNTPITPIRLQLHLLSAGALGTLEPSQARAVQIASRNLDRLAALVQEILDVTRLEGGALRLKLESVPLDELITETWDAYEEPARRVGIRLLRPQASNAVVHTDKQRALQILYNLVSNAIKFTPADGEIRMTVSPVANNGVQVCLQDSGAGLTPEQVDGLFKPFARMHEEMAVGGTGLGLYICATLTAQLGGKLVATSAGPGKGSCFCLTLPREATVVAHIPTQVDLQQDALARRLRELI